MNLSEINEMLESVVDDLSEVMGRKSLRRFGSRMARKRSRIGKVGKVLNILQQRRRERHALLHSK